MRGPYSFPIFFSFVFASAISHAAEINVPADQPTIQAAIDAADDGDTVIVHPGSYVGEIDFPAKAITVRSTDPEDDDVVASTVIEGNVIFAAGATLNSLITGFTIVEGGIGCEGASPTIYRNVLAGR